ncbi:MAG: prepilin-type N-terminal cleavage/methylation domain-containing protein [Tissierellia bacterium]|nr:prepilin-type N-terminal cleavage/methylation domain-containing protein [Tissierellia bacterium]
MKVWKNRKYFQGFTLIELLFALAIGSIIVICLYTILNFTINAYKFTDTQDEILLNGRYAIEYIKREIRSAEKIMDINLDIFSEIVEDYGDNIGFVIMRYNPDSNSIDKYNYSTYYLKNNKIYRLAVNRAIEEYPKGASFGGHNQIAESVISIEGTGADFEAGLIDLSFILKGEQGRDINFRTRLNIRCPVVY